MPDASRRRSLESLRKEAKRWLTALEEKDPHARSRFVLAWPNGPGAPTLRDVQHALALEHGEPGWAALKQRVTAEADAVTDSLAHYQEKVAALLDAYHTGTPAAMERHWKLTWHRRPWDGMRSYVLADLGKSPGDESVTQEDAQWLIAREHGFADWAALQQAIASSPKPALLTAKPMEVLSPVPNNLAFKISRFRDWNNVLADLSDPSATGLDAHGQMTDEILKQIVPFAHLTTIKLGGSQLLTDDGVRLLARMPMLSHLDLSGTSITDAGMAALKDLKELRRLSLSGTRVTDAGMAALSDLVKLESVDLTWTRCGDGAIQALAHKPVLSHFRSGNGVTDTGIRAFHDYPVFKEWQGGVEESSLTGYETQPNNLFLRGQFTDRGVAHLEGLDGLHGLNLDDASLALSGKALEPLVDLARLGWLAFDAKDDAMPYIARMRHLKFLACQDTTASDAAWVELGASRSIEKIWGRRCYGLGDKGFLALSRMPSLGNLSVSCKNVSDTALESLPNFPALRELMPMDVPDAGYRHIGKCQQLESLVLMYCRDTTDAATAHITGLTRLLAYFASYTQITNRTPELLAQIDSLERVTFDSCAGLTNAGILALARLPHLKELRVSGRGLTEDLVSAFPGWVTVHYSL